LQSGAPPRFVFPGLAAVSARRAMLDIGDRGAMMGLVAMAEDRRKKLTPSEARNLDIEIKFLAGLTRRDPEYVEALELLGEAYTRRGRYPEGLAVDLRLAALKPDSALVHYNLACSYSLTRQPEAAYEALNRAVDLGYRDFQYLARDPDLADFRRHPLYRKLQKRLRSLQEPVC
jgi:tetratricopeptide (TPR) repeat protein